MSVSTISSTSLIQLLKFKTWETRLFKMSHLGTPRFQTRRWVTVAFGHCRIPRFGVLQGTTKVHFPLHQFFICFLCCLVFVDVCWLSVITFIWQTREGSKLIVFLHRLVQNKKKKKSRSFLALKADLCNRGSQDLLSEALWNFFYADLATPKLLCINLNGL